MSILHLRLFRSLESACSFLFFLCTFIGVKLDEKFGTPFTIPLIILGILAGARNVYVLVQKTKETIEAEKDDEEE